MNKPAGVAFIGAGFIAYLHIIAIRSNPNTKLVAVASRSKKIAENRARIFNAEPYTFDNLGEMLARKDIDIVFVQSPNSLHGEHALAALAAGKHLIMEKPMTITLAEADSIISAANSAGLRVAYAENQVFAPLIIKARELIEQGQIGKVLSVTGYCGHGGPSPSGWYRKAQFSGGGAHIDLGPHTLEASLYLAGKPRVERVKSCLMTEAPEGIIDGRAEAVLECEHGIELHVTSSWLDADDQFYYEVKGSNGSLKAVFSPPPQFLTLYRPNGEAEDIEFPGRFDMHLDKFLGSSGYIGQLEHFETCFRTGTVPRESAIDGRNVLQILAAGYLSAATHRPATLADVPLDKTPIQLLRAT
ncbi:MAG: oxidoreductase [Candidatus Abyssubacteria bacterium]